MPDTDPPLHLFVVEAPETLREAHMSVFRTPLTHTAQGWRRLDATWWRKKPNAFASAQIATTHAWLRHWAKHTLTETHWRNLTKREALIDVELLSVWDQGAIARITPHRQAGTDRLWRACLGLVPTPDAPIGIAMLNTPYPQSAHAMMTALGSIPPWAWHGPVGQLLDVPDPSWVAHTYGTRMKRGAGLRLVY